jgi:hypothetical protein
VVEVEVTRPWRDVRRRAEVSALVPALPEGWADKTVPLEKRQKTAAVQKLRQSVGPLTARQRLGLRQSSAAFLQPQTFRWETRP